MRDVGSVELGAQTYGQIFTLNGKPAAGMAIFQSPGANALRRRRVPSKDRMTLLEKDFPPGTGRRRSARHHQIRRRNRFRPSTKRSIEAGVLVLLVILVFLQDWRAPPRAGHHGARNHHRRVLRHVAAPGFSVNMLTLFGLVLAIGIVVDDAIVVVENAAHHIERGLVSPSQATIQAMGEVLGPIISITLVLMSVFLPSVFMGRHHRPQLYQQFALTIAATAPLISAINAVTLKPAQWHSGCARRCHRSSATFSIEASTQSMIGSKHGYAGLIRRLVGVSALVGTGRRRHHRAFRSTGYHESRPVSCRSKTRAICWPPFNCPTAASLSRTQQSLDTVAAIARKEPAVQDVITIAGVSALDNNASLANAGIAYLVLKPWSDRDSLLAALSAHGLGV